MHTALVGLSNTSDLLGTSSLDSTSDLLAMLDTAAEEDGMKFNGAVLRRALKSRGNGHFKMQQWEALTTSTFQTITDRFIQEDDGVTSSDFIVLVCSQVWQKLLKAATTATKPKAHRSHSLVTIPYSGYSTAILFSLV